jgi:hypothetical protein
LFNESRRLKASELSRPSHLSPAAQASGSREDFGTRADPVGLYNEVHCIMSVSTMPQIKKISEKG